MKKNIFLSIFLIFCLAYPQTILAEEKTITILYLGDSITEGFGIGPEEAYPTLVENKLKKAGHQNIKTINGGYSGSTSASALSRLKWYSRIKPDIVVLALGANDGLRGLSTETMQTNLAKAIEFAQSAGMKVVLCGMMAPPNYGKDYTAAFKHVFPALATNYRVTLIPFLLEGVGGVLGNNLPDGIHPNQKGHQLIAETVFPVLLGILQAHE